MKSTELARFMSIRQVQPLLVDSTLQPSNTPPLVTITHIDPTKSTFFLRLDPSSSKAVVWDVSKAKLTSFARSEKFLSSESALIAKQPGLDKLAKLFAINQVDSKLTTIILQFENNNPSGNSDKHIKESVKEYATRTKLKDNLIIFWDNLIYRAVSKSNFAQVPTLVNTIRLASVLYNAATRPKDLFNQTLLSIKFSTLAMPSDIFVMPKLEPDNLCFKPAAQVPCDGNVSTLWPETKGDVQPLGWGDLKIIKSTLLRYAAGEIAHVENILALENHTREFRDLRSTKTTDELEKETQTEVTSSLQTTEKFSFEQEVAKSSSQSADLKAGFSTTYDYGAVTAPWGLSHGAAYGDYQGKSTKDESQKNATKYAKDIVTDATSKLTQKVKSFHSVSTLSEKEETTTQGILNTTLEHRSGIYRWLDKYYLAHVENYGQRLMYEFAVPEPAAFFRYAKLRHEESELLKPISPRHFKMQSRDQSGQLIPNKFYMLSSFTDLTRDNYQYWLAEYGATSATPPPSQKKYVDWAKVSALSSTIQTDAIDLEVPGNYIAKKAFINTSLPWGGSVRGTLGRQNYTSNGIHPPIAMNDEVGKIPVTYASTDPFGLNITIECELSAEGLDAWRITIFEGIMQAYAKQLSGYEENMHQNEADRTNALFGMNPDINRQTEQIELKKSCLEIITKQRFESIDAMRDTNGYFGHPEFSFSEASNEGSYIQFFEKAFEWVNMTYTFAPYFWGRKDKWLDTLKLADVDPLFENFLRSGSARVVVPVRPGYENDVLAFFTFGWNGMQHYLVTIDDARYVSIVEELKEQAGLFPGRHIEPERWVVKVPTTLVYLEDSGSILPDYTKQLWWQPKLRVLVVDSSNVPITSAKVTIDRGLQAETVLLSPNGSAPGAYDFMLDEGTYKIDAADVGINSAGISSWLPGTGTTVVEMSQETMVAITLWRITVTVTDSNGPVSNATVTVSCLDEEGVHEVQLIGISSGSLPGTYEFMVNPGTYSIAVNGLLSTTSVFQDTPVTIVI